MSEDFTIRMLKSDNYDASILLLIGENSIIKMKKRNGHVYWKSNIKVRTGQLSGIKGLI